MGLGKVHRLFKKDVVAIACELFRDVVVTKNGIKEAVAGRIAFLADPTPHMVEAFLESHVRRPYGKVVSQMPLAENSGLVAGISKSCRQGPFIFAQQ